jgi:hypothetical protein
MKYGLWEDGKRIQWFDLETSEKIMRDEVDFSQFFTKTESKDYVDNSTFFTRPYGFDEALDHVKQQFEGRTSV